MKGFHTLRIDCASPTGVGARVYLDGHELHLRSLRLDLAAGEVNQASIVLNVDHIDVTAQALAMLTAHLADTTRPRFSGIVPESHTVVLDERDFPLHVPNPKGGE